MQISRAECFDKKKAKLERKRGDHASGALKKAQVCRKMGSEKEKGTFTPEHEGRGGQPNLLRGGRSSP